MKILQVLDNFYPNLDGPIESMLSISRKIMEKGLGTVEVLVPSYPEKVEVEGITVHRCFSIPSNEDYRAALPQLDRKVKKLIKEGGFDVIHLQSPFILSKYALKWGHRYGIPVVFTMRTKFRDEFKNRLKLNVLVKFMMGYIMRGINRCDAVTAVSDGTVDTLAEYGYKKCGEVKVISNATNMLPLSADKRLTDGVRQKWSLGDNFTFMFAGRLAEVKNIQLSLNALSIVKKRGYGGFRFVIVGDGAYGKALKKLAQELDLSENVVFAGRVTDKSELAAYYAASDLFLFPSKFDTFGLVVQEAAANGVPSATIKGTCASERITDGESGFVWDDGAEVWAENIIALMNDREAVKRAGAGAVSSVYRSWDEIAEEYVAVYNSLIDGKKA